MVEALVLKAEKRQNSGTAATRRLRLQGRVPAIVYGHQQEPLAVHLDYHDLWLEVQHRHQLLDVELDGKTEKLLIKDLQYNHLYSKIIHVDLTRVDLDERVTVTVPIDLRGTPAGLSEGGVLDQMLADLELECAVTSIPENIRVMVNELNVGETIYARDLELPEGSTLSTDPDAPVVTVRVLAEEVEEAPAEGEAEEPEIIAREKDEDQAEEPQS